MFGDTPNPNHKASLCSRYKADEPQMIVRCQIADAWGSPQTPLENLDRLPTAVDGSS